MKSAKTCLINSADGSGEGGLQHATAGGSSAVLGQGTGLDRIQTWMTGCPLGVIPCHFMHLFNTSLYFLISILLLYLQIKQGWAQLSKSVLYPIAALSLFMIKIINVRVFTVYLHCLFTKYMIYG